MIFYFLIFSAITSSGTQCPKLTIVINLKQITNFKTIIVNLEKRSCWIDHIRILTIGLEQHILQWTLILGNLFKCKYLLLFSPALPPLQASSSPIPWNTDMVYWGHCKLKSTNERKSNQMLIFEERGKPEYSEKNLSEQNRKPTNSTPSGNRTRAILVGGGECSHHPCNQAVESLE